MAIVAWTHRTGSSGPEAHGSQSRAACGRMPQSGLPPLHAETPTFKRLFQDGLVKYSVQSDTLFASRECTGTTVSAPPTRHCRGPSGWLLWIDVHVRRVSEETNPLFLLPLLCHLHREKWISDGVRYMTPALCRSKRCRKRQAKCQTR